MAFGFALCATMVFAQIPAKKATRASLESSRVEAVAMPTEDVQEQATFKGSIFSKNVVVKEVETFGAAASAATYQVGTATIPYAHTQSAAHSRWFRVADTTRTAVNAVSSIAPVLFDPNGDGTFSTLSSFMSGSPMDGLMACSMQDQIAAWGGTGTIGNFNTYIEFPAFSTVPGEGETIAILDAKLYQYYRCFNSDKCNIDYSIDGGTTWDSIEFNVAGIDVSVNSSIRGWKTVTLPLSLLNQESVKLRLRYSCNSNTGGAYGYFWLVDDFSVEGIAEANRMNVQTVSYYHGGYHMVPQGMDVNPVVWYSRFTNNGDRNQTNVKGYIKTIDGTEIASSYVDTTVEIGATKFSFIDNTTNINAVEPSVLGEGWQGTASPLPHATVGVNKIYSGLQSDELDYKFDTMAYNVLAAEGDGTQVWGRDNGILTQYSTWTYGVTADNLHTEEARYSDAGYLVAISYATPENVPEGWVIRGIELVAHTHPQYYGDVEAGMVKISPWFRYDSTEPSPNGGTLYSFKPIETGAGTYTVTMDDLNLDTNVNYMEYGDYNTIRIMFPEQPELLPSTHYRAGYELVEQAYFCLASDRNFYYDVESGADTAVYYSDEPELADFANRFGNGSNANVFNFTPEYGVTGSFLGSSAGKNVPMIRMLVGPKRDIPTHTITVSWNEIDSAGIFNAETLMGVENGSADVVAEGSTRSYIVSPESSDESVWVEGITVDGADVMDQCEYSSAGGYYTYTFANITANHTLAAEFKKRVGIDAIENNVKVSMQPNPATAQTQMTIEGVNGEINFSLIDMSGRVIAEEVINANEVKTINVSSLAKGTYFVRLTNSNFSKVEKLIVR